MYGRDKSVQRIASGRHRSGDLASQRQIAYLVNFLVPHHDRAWINRVTRLSYQFDALTDRAARDRILKVAFAYYGNRLYIVRTADIMSAFQSRSPLFSLSTDTSHGGSQRFNGHPTFRHRSRYLKGRAVIGSWGDGRHTRRFLACQRAGKIAMALQNVVRPSHQSDI